MKQLIRKIKKQGNAVILVLTLLFGIMSPAFTVEVDAVPKWKAAYKKILKNPEVDSYGDISYLHMYFGSGCKFDRYFVCNVDKNKTPELFLCSTTMPLTAVFTYRNGKLVYLGYQDFYKINKAKKCLVVQGHWHGAGGSGGNEYSVYNIGKNELKSILYMDYLNDKYSVYYNNGKNYESATSEKYDKVYNKYIKGGKKFSSFKKYKLSNRKGLKVQ